VSKRSHNAGSTVARLHTVGLPLLVAFLGALFFFAIVGVFGLRWAIAALAVFVVGTLAIYRAFPTEGPDV
jgi:NADH:ubiquinone oxidoreductase subunit 4 (subunit M)